MKTNDLCKNFEAAIYLVVIEIMLFIILPIWLKTKLRPLLPLLLFLIISVGIILYGRYYNWIRDTENKLWGKPFLTNNGYKTDWNPSSGSINKFDLYLNF